MTHPRDFQPARAISQPETNFDPVARVYRWAEYLCLGPLLQRTRVHFLEQVADAHAALVLGDGDGRFLARLLQHAPTLRATAVDSSLAMLALLCRRCTFAGARLEVQQGQLPRLAADVDLKGVDLVVSHFVLDCLDAAELTALAQTLASQLPPGTRWLVSDFGVPQRQPWHTMARAYIRLLYLAFGLLTRLRPRQLPEIEATLQQAGFQRVSRHTRLRGLLYTEIWVLGT